MAATPVDTTASWSEWTVSTEMDPTAGTTVLEEEESSLYGPPSGATLILLLPMLLLVVCTFAANIAVMVCTRSEKKLRAATANLYVFSLAAVDSIVGLVTMPFMCVYTLYGYWPLGDVPCTFWVNVDFVGCTISMFHLCLIAHDRWQALTNPLQYRSPNKSKKTLQLIGVAWLLGTLVWMPPILAYRKLQDPVTNECWFVPDKTFVLVQAIVIYYGPIVVMVYFYVKSVIGLRALFAKIRAMHSGSANPSGATVATSLGDGMSTTGELTFASEEVTDFQTVSTSFTTSVSTVGVSGQLQSGQAKKRVVNQAVKRRQEHVKALRTLGVVMATFLICWLPFCIFWPVAAFCETCIPPKLYEYSYWSAYLNSTVNPCLYFIANRDFRRAFRNIFRKNKHRKKTINI